MLAIDANVWIALIVGVVIVIAVLGAFSGPGRTLRMKWKGVDVQTQTQQQPSDIKFANRAEIRKGAEVERVVALQNTDLAPGQNLEALNGVIIEGKVKTLAGIVHDEPKKDQ
jgi:hypothetical protein